MGFPFLAISIKVGVSVHSPEPILYKSTKSSISVAAFNENGVHIYKIPFWSQ